MLTIAPLFAAFIPGSTARATSQADLRSTANTSSHSSSVIVTGSSSTTAQTRLRVSWLQSGSLRRNRSRARDNSSDKCGEQPERDRKPGSFGDKANHSGADNIAG